MSSQDSRIQTYAEFWPFYLKEHSHPMNRRLHYVGTALSIIILVLAVVLMNPWFILLAAVSGYAFAWIGHFLVERNRPATFKYPLWSLISDYRMFFCAMMGKLPKA